MIFVPQAIGSSFLAPQQPRPRRKQVSITATSSLQVWAKSENKIASGGVRTRDPLLSPWVGSRYANHCTTDALSFDYQDGSKQNKYILIKLQPKASQQLPNSALLTKRMMLLSQFLAEEVKVM